MVFMNAENMVKKSEQMLITSIFFFSHKPYSIIKLMKGSSPMSQPFDMHV
jgi:hypothetical protein